MYYNTKKLKLSLVASYKIRPGNGEGLFLFWRFINLSLTYLLRHLPTYLQPRTHTGHLCKVSEWLDVLCDHLFFFIWKTTHEGRHVAPFCRFINATMHVEISYFDDSQSLDL